MKKCIASVLQNLVAISFVVFSTPVLAHATIGVFDLNRAVFATEAWQEELQNLEEVFREDQESAETIRAELAELMQSIETNGPVLSIAEMQRLQEESQVKQLQLQRMGERVQAALVNTQNAFIERYRGLLGDAINDVYEDGGYDLILRSESVVLSGFTFDVTSEVTATLNNLIADTDSN